MRTGAGVSLTRLCTSSWQSELAVESAIFVCSAASTLPEAPRTCLDSCASRRAEVARVAAFLSRRRHWQVGMEDRHGAAPTIGCQVLECAAGGHT